MRALTREPANADASWDRVSANYLQNLGMRILRGRGFTDADNETTARYFEAMVGFTQPFFITPCDGRKLR
jgi:hypothetical protein